jgi:PAS domain S-box-containing protein
VHEENATIPDHTDKIWLIADIVDVVDIVGDGRVRLRRSGWLIVVLVGILLAWCPNGRALNQSMDVSQYAHTSWKVRQGLVKGTTWTIAQTPDGYLWLGTEFGLLRFDGVKTVPWQPPAGELLPSNIVLDLLVARDRTLWIGTHKGLASWKDGKLTRYPDLDGQEISSVIEDREGTIWTSSWGSRTGRLCAIHNGKTTCHGEDGSFGVGLYCLYEDSKGNLWAGGMTGVWQWKPGHPKFYPIPGRARDISVLSLTEGDDGAILILTPDGFFQLVDGRAKMYTPPGNAQHFAPNRWMRDRDGGLWIGTMGHGLVHVHQGRADTFGQSDGLSSDYISSLFEDREGNVWIGTTGGLDRFNGFTISTISAKQGLSDTNVWSVLASRDGSVWLGTAEGVNRWKDGQITTYERRSVARAAHLLIPGAVNGIADDELPDSGVDSLYQDEQGAIWVSTLSGIAYFENGRFNTVGGLPHGAVHSMAGDRAGNLWIAFSQFGLFQLLGGKVVERIPWEKLGHSGPSLALLHDPVRGGLWLGFVGGGIAYFKDGQVRAQYAEADGLGHGTVRNLQLDKDGTLWAATEGGLSRLKSGRFVTLSSQNGLPCDAVHWMMEDDAGSVWLHTGCGLVRIARTELDAWAADPKRKIQSNVFDSSDGAMIRATISAFSPLVTKSVDGKLWFSDTDGVGVINPNSIPFNRIPPPVYIEQLIADDKTYNLADGANVKLQVAPHVRDLEIDYTALSFVVPEKNRFRYMLEGQDPEWKEVVNERQVRYTNLAHGHYVFRVIACNNDGVWNETGATLKFSIRPAFYQTTWFRLLCGAAVLLLLWGLYQLRLQQVRRQFDARLAERARIVEELHLIIDSIPGFVCVMSPEGEVEFLNRRLLEYFGKTFEEMRGGWATNGSIHPEERDQSFAMFKYSMKTGNPHEFEQRYLRADGVYRWFHRSACPVRGTDGKITGWYALMTDIEDRKRAEDELQRKEAFLAEGQQLSSTGTFCWRLDTDEVVFSEEAYRIFELETNAPVTLERIGERIHPDDIPMLSEKMNQARTTGDKQDYEIRLTMADGDIKYVHISSHATTYQDGHLEYIGAIQDGTERRLAEEAVNKLRSELTHMARATSLGVLTASIAHEVSQPLSGIMTNASTCLRMLGADPPDLSGALETARRTIRDGNRASEVVIRLRALFSKKETKAETVDLNEAAREVLAICADELQRHRVIVRQELANGLPLATGDRVQLQQVILNLLRNASDAMSGVTDRSRDLTIRTEKDEGNCVRLTVQDTGEGIATQDIGRLFDAFYTTKRDGMGIGLSVSHSIIEHHGGRLWATPNDGPGATFSFSIPCKFNSIK